MTDKVFGFLWKYLSRLKFLFLCVLCSVVLGEAFVRVALYYGSQIVEILSSSLPREDILRQTLFLAGLTAVFLFLKGILLNAVLFVEARFIPKYNTLIAKDLFNYAHQHSTAFFAEEMAGNISAKIKTILDNCNMIYYNLLWGFISPAIGIIISFAFILDINIELGAILIVLNLFLIAAIYWLSQRIAPYSEKRSKLMSEANGVLVDSISNAALVKNFSNYVYEKRYYFREMKKAALADRAETNQYGILFVGQGVLRALMEAVSYALPIWYWYIGEINVGQFVLIQSLVATLNNIYNMLSFNFMNFFKLYGGIRDGLKLLSRPREVVDVPGAAVFNGDSAAIEFKDVTYHYKGAEPLFKDFNLKIKDGEKVGLVGRSGSGKSTLIKLICRYYDIQSGEISLGEQNIAALKQDSLRRNIALIPQEPSLFNRSIMDNIRYGNLKASDEEVFAAAKKAFCHDFIMALPEGYNSRVGDRGVMLSGGERQRIAIARAILKNAPVLILDEATSALDSESEKYIQDSLQNLMKGKTVIAIAHRLSTLKEMDTIVVMDKGVIAEQGSHQNLVRKKGVYYNFYNMQSSGFLKEA